MPYDYQKGLKFEKWAMEIYIAYLKSLGAEVEDLTGTKADYQHRGDLLVNGKLVQCKHRTELYYRYHLRDNLIWVSIADDRVTKKGGAGTSTLRDNSDYWVTCYYLEENLVKVITIETAKFKPWIKENQHLYSKRSAGRGSGTVGLFVCLADIPSEFCVITNPPLS